MGRYSTHRMVLVPATMLERWADELVELRRNAGGQLDADDERVVKVIRELRRVSDLASTV